MILSPMLLLLAMLSLALAVVNLGHLCMLLQRVEENEIPWPELGRILRPAEVALLGLGLGIIFLCISLLLGVAG